MTVFLSAFALKVMMAALMLLDHLYYDLCPELRIWHLAARVVAPVFIFLVTEGIVHTRSRPRYLVRLFAFALAMMAGNAVLWIIFGSWVPNSMLMTLALSAAVIVCVEHVHKGGGGQWMAVAGAAFLLTRFFEGGYMVPCIALVFYYLRGRPVSMSIAYAVMCTGFLWGDILRLNGIPDQLYMLLGIVPILLYNGRRGPSGKVAQYFFYLFYPLHIWVIFIIVQMQ